MQSENSISIIIPALNEEHTLKDAVEAVLGAAQEHFDEYEIIIINDGSTDRTGEIAEELRKTGIPITVIHHDKPRGLGGAFKKGLSLAGMHFVTLVNGKNDTTSEELGKIWALKNTADIIVPYQFDPSYRHTMRRTVSRAFVLLLNALFRLNLKYYNHYVLHRRSSVSSIRIRTNSHAFQAEALIKLIRKGLSFVEVGHLEKPEIPGPTRVFRLKNIRGVAKFLFFIFYDIYIADTERKQ